MTVKIRTNACQLHAKTVPNHAGYTRDGMTWRDIVAELEGKEVKVERIFPNGNMNVYGPTGIVHLPAYMIEKESEGRQ